MAVSKGANKEVQPALTGNDYLAIAKQKAEIIKQKPSIVLAVPTHPVDGLTVSWRKPTKGEMLHQNADAVLEISSQVPPKLGRHSGGTRMLLQKRFSTDVEDALEFGQVAEGVRVLVEAGAFNPDHIAKIQEVLMNPPDEIKTRMDTAAEIRAWQSQIRPVRKGHSFVDEWIRPAVLLVTRKIPFIK